MTAPQPYLIIDNTRPIDPTLPDLYDGIAANDDEQPLVTAAIAIGGFLGRASGWAFWVAVGIVAGVFVL